VRLELVGCALFKLAFLAGIPAFYTLKVAAYPAVYLAGLLELRLYLVAGQALADELAAKPVADLLAGGYVGGAVKAFHSESFVYSLSSVYRGVSFLSAEKQLAINRPKLTARKLPVVRSPDEKVI
jgi:hypothetical protein